MSDEQYNEMVRRQLLEQEDSYFTNIEHNKGAVWNRIENRLEKKKIVPFWIYALAAVIIIFICFGFIFNYQLQKRNIEIANLKLQLELKKTEIEITYIKPFFKPNHSDSIKYVNGRIVYLPVQMIDTIVLHDTINNLVLRTDTIFIKEKTNDQIAINETVNNKNLTQNKNIVVNQISKEKKRERKFILQFGKSRNEMPANETLDETRGLITLKSK